MNRSALFSTLWLTAAALFAGAWMVTAGAETQKPRPEKAKPVSASELSDLFGDRTWRWGAGGARFVAERRKLVAYSEEGGNSTVAEGHWEGTDSGLLCLVARWTTKASEASKRTCFRHVRDRGTIFQRREPNGDWYVFRSNRPKPEDEFAKLIKEDTITPNVEELRKTLKASPGQGG